MTDQTVRMISEAENQEQRLRDMARTIAEELTGTNLTATGTNLAVTSASIRVSVDGSVYASASLKVSKYISSRSMIRHETETD